MELGTFSNSTSTASSYVSIFETLWKQSGMYVIQYTFRKSLTIADGSNNRQRRLGRIPHRVYQKQPWRNLRLRQGLEDFSSVISELWPMCPMWRLESGSFFVSFSTLPVPLEVEPSEFFLYSKEVGSQWSHRTHGGDQESIQQVKSHNMKLISN